MWCTAVVDYFSYSSCVPQEQPYTAKGKQYKPTPKPPKTDQFNCQHDTTTPAAITIHTKQKPVSY